MAKSSPAKAAVRKGKMRASPLVEGLNLYDAVLVDCNLDWSPQGTEDEDSKKNLQLFYDGVIQFVERTLKQKRTVALCVFSAGQRTKDKKNIFEVRSQYMVAVSHDDGQGVLSGMDRKKLLEEVVAISAWPLFRSLFAHMVSQTVMDLPLLPSTPRLRWLRPGEDESKEEEKLT